MNPNVVTLSQEHVDEMFAHAARTLPEECCGLIGGRDDVASGVYPLRNAARDARVRYEADLQELLRAQKRMRAANEELLAIYHSHPRAAEPEPSETDVRLAYHPRVVYFIIGFDAGAPVLRAFRIYADEARWEAASFRVG